MIRLCSFLLAVGLLGCGTAGNESADTTKENTTKDEKAAPRKGAKPTIFRPQPKQVTVPADAYPDVPVAVSALAEAAESNRGGEILRCCAWLKMQGNDAVQPLGELLLSSTTPKNTRYHVCRALGDIGAPAVPLLIKTLDTDSVELRIGVLNGLGRVKSDDQATNDRIARALLKRASKDESSLDTRRFALRALASLGKPAGTVAKDPLQTMLHDPHEDGTLKGEIRIALKAVAPRRTFVD